MSKEERLNLIKHLQDLNAAEDTAAKQKTPSKDPDKKKTTPTKSITKIESSKQDTYSRYDIDIIDTNDSQIQFNEAKPDIVNFFKDKFISPNITL